MIKKIVCKKCNGWGEIEKESQLANCDSCSGDYFYNVKGVPINQQDRGYELIKEEIKCLQN